MIRSNKNAIVIVAGVVLLYLASIYATQRFFTSIAPGANDFYPRWKGAQLFWEQGIDPYSDVTSEAIQQGIYGRPALPEEDQLLFVYPFYTVFLLVPLILLPLSYSWIQAIWLVTLQFSLIASVLLCLRLLDWRMPVWLLAATVLWGVLFYNSARTIILGQFTALIFLWLVSSLLALKQGRDALAGVMLAFTTIKPQMTFLVIPALMLWGIYHRRLRFVIGFVTAVVLLLGASFLFLPGWLSGFIEQVRYYPAYTVTPPPLWVITSYYLPALGKTVERVLAVLLLLTMLYGWRHLPRLSADSDRFLLLLGLTLVVTNMVVVRTATTNYVVLYIPLFWGLKQMADRLPRGRLLVALFYLLSSIVMWTLFLITIEGDFEHPIMYLPLPLGLLVMLVWASRDRAAAVPPQPG